MASERGSVEIGAVPVGHLVEVVKTVRDPDNKRRLMGFVQEPTDEGVAIRLQHSPEHRRAHLRMIFKDATVKVYDWGKSAKTPGGIRNLQDETRSRVGGHRPVPTRPYGY